MPNTQLNIVDDLVVSLNVTMRLKENADMAPPQEQGLLVFLQGYGQIIAGVERVLYGLTINDEMEIKVDPVDGFGLVDHTNVRRISRGAIPADQILHLGDEIQVRDPLGHVLDAYVTNIEPDSVLLDFNHPLAGETLYVHFKVVDIRTATPEELDQGFVQN